MELLKINVKYLLVSKFEIIFTSDLALDQLSIN